MKLLTDLQIILAEVFSIEDPRAIGQGIRLALLHIGILGFSIGMAFVANYLGELGVDWKTLLYISLFGGTGGNAALHIRTPQASATIDAAQRIIRFSEKAQPQNLNEND